MVRRALEAQERWCDGEVIDAAREASRIALRVAAEALFGADVEGDLLTIEDALSEAVDQFRMARIPVHRLLERLPLPSTLRFRRARATLDEVVQRFVRARRATGLGGRDLLSDLLQARDPAIARMPGRPVCGGHARFQWGARVGL